MTPLATRGAGALIFSILLALVAARCGDEKDPTCVTGCEGGLLDETACGLVVTVSPACDGPVELLVNGCLEPTAVEPGTTYEACARLEEGQALELWARSSSTLWYIDSGRCKETGAYSLSYTLTCDEGAVQADATGEVATTDAL